MKTTVKNTWGSNVTVDRMGPHVVSLELLQGLAVDHCFLDKHSAFVLGNALIHLAQTIEAEEGGYELCNKVSSGVACTSRKGTKCPDCGPCLVDYGEKQTESEVCNGVAL